MSEGDSLEDGPRAGLRRARRLLHAADGDRRQAGARARRLRLQAGRRRRDRRLRRHLLRVPVAGPSAGRRATRSIFEPGPEQIYSWNVSPSLDDAATIRRRDAGPRGCRRPRAQPVPAPRAAASDGDGTCRDPQSRTAGTTSPSASTPPLDVEILGHAGYFVAGMNQAGPTSRCTATSAGASPRT